MPKNTCLPIVCARASFSASSTFHLVLEALQPGQLCLPDCPHQPNCLSPSSCPVRHSALRKVASQLLLGISLLHDKMGYIHADLKPENVLRCRGITISVRMITIDSLTSLKLKLIDLGNAVPIDRMNIYYSDFEIQSVHYRAPEVVFYISLLNSGPARFAFELCYRHILTRFDPS
jgi:serine/threonine protein kinase